jgi:hypothetical protein
VSCLMDKYQTLHPFCLRFDTVQAVLLCIASTAGCGATIYPLPRPRINAGGARPQGVTFEGSKSIIQAAKRSI